MMNIENYDPLTQSKLEQSTDLLSYKPNNNKMLAFHKSNSKTRLLLGGKRSGKTYSHIVEICWAATGIHPFLPYPPPPLQIRYCTVDFNAIFRIALPYFKRFLYPWAWDGHCSKERPIILLRNGTEIELKSFESELESFEGTSRQIVGMDEEPPLDIFQSNFMRTVDVGGKLIISCTPIHGLSWLYSELYDNPDAVPPAVEHWHVRTDENPHISKDEIEAVKANPAMRDNLDAALMGEFIPKSGLVFKSFSDKNIIEPMVITNDHMIILGIDPHDRNPWGIPFIAFNRENEYIVYDEILQAGTVPEIAEEILKKLKGRKPQLCVMDTSGNIVQATSGKSYKEMLMPYGLYCQDADKRVSEGILELNALLDQGKNKRPRLFVTRNCVNTIRQFHHLIWDNWARNRDQRDPKERILKKDNHILDALRYACMVPIVYRHPDFHAIPKTPVKISRVTGYF
jgi:phage terminase large subunit-like protein